MCCRRGPATARGEAAPEAAAADDEDEEPLLAPQLCALRLREYSRSVAYRRKALEDAEHTFALAVSEIKRRCAYNLQEQQYHKVMHMRLQRAGDAWGAQLFGLREKEFAATLLEEQQQLEALLTDGPERIRVRDAAAELQRTEHKHTLLREYTLERHGAEWAPDKSENLKLRDDELREQARQWYASRAPQ